ncbi:MAG: UDP-2,3-diacylglucosamine diphosphatase LpxI [Pseudomonadota bacterium]
MPDETPSGRIGLIAGNGSLPVMVARTLSINGKSPFIVGIEGEAESALRDFDFVSAYSGHPGKVVSALKKAKVTDVVMVGGVKGRPSLSRLRPDWTTLKVARKMLASLGKGDDALLRSVIDIIEDSNIRVRGVHELVPDLLAPMGVLAGPDLDIATKQSVTTAINGAVALGLLDAGQAAVAIGRRVVALEGAEGTDLMLGRVQELRKIERLQKKPGGALVKLAKPGQELRADLPTIGPSTVRNAALASLKAIAVHAGRALIVDIEETKALAQQSKITLLGIDPDEFIGG